MDTAVPHPDTMPVETAAWPAAWGALLLLAAVGTGLSLAVGGKHAFGFLPTLTFMVCLLAAWFDAGTGRIPNPLTYVALALGLGLNLIAALAAMQSNSPTLGWLGATTVSDCLMGFGIYAVAGVMALMVAGLGGGDMKLIAALGALLGAQAATQVVFWGLSTAVVYALINVIARGKVNAAMQALSLNILSILYLRQSADVQALPTRKIPLALPMALGIIAARLAPLGVLNGN